MTKYIPSGPVWLCLLTVLALVSPWGWAQEIPLEPELVTDRPDQTESSSVVPPGHVQIETGWSFSRTQTDGARTQVHQWPGTLVRMGLLPGMELRAGWSGGVWEEVEQGGGRNGSAGSADPELGAKLHFWEEQGWAPQTALLIGVSLPLGHEEVSSGRSDPGFRLAMSHTLSERFSLGYNLGASWETELGELGDRVTFSFFNYTVAVGTSISQRTGLFVEAFGDIPLSAPGGSRNSLDGGLTYLLRNHLQLDASTGLGLSRSAEDWFVSVGLSLRLPR